MIIAEKIKFRNGAIGYQVYSKENKRLIDVTDDQGETIYTGVSSAFQFWDVEGLPKEYEDIGEFYASL